METLLFVALAVIVAFSLGRERAPTPQIIYVQPDRAEVGSIGCLPLIIIGVLLLLTLGIVRF